MLVGGMLLGLAMVCALMMERGGAKDDFARLKSNLVNYWIGAEADRNDAQVRASLQRLEEQARAALTSLRADGSWPDLDCRSESDYEFHAAQHASRAATLAMGYRTPGQALCGSAEIAPAVTRALSHLNEVIGRGWPTTGGWWQLQIAIPRSLGETLLLMEGSLGAEIVAKTVQTIRYLLMEEAPSGQGVIWHITLLPTDAPPGEKHQATGENMVWLAMNHFYRDLVTGDEAHLAPVRDGIIGQCTTHPEATVGVHGEGIKEDYSFHQHGALLYTGGYGRSFFEDVPIYLWAARGTRYQVPQAGLDEFARYALDSSLWCIYENFYDPSCRGREVTRAERAPMEAPLALLVLANLEHARRVEAVRAAKACHQFNGSYQLRTAALWTAIKDKPGSALLPLGHKHFWESDYTVHREARYFASLRMFSDRTRPAECIHLEGKTSWHQSNGLLWVFLHGRDYATDNVLPTLDWLRLPGTTVERKHLEPMEGFEGWPPPLGKRAFVGGAHTGARGVSAMELAAMVPPLTARKSWFFFGDEIVCLGSDIDCQSEHATETSVTQWPLTTPAAPLTIDGKEMPVTLPWSEELAAPRWAQCDGIGYYFLELQSLRAQRVEQSGSWQLLSEGASDIVHSHPFLTLWYDHGAQAKGAGYAYAVLPGKDATEMASYAAAPPVEVLARDGRVHAVRHTARRALGAAFWQAGAVDRLSVDRPCLLYWEEDDNGATLAVSDPTHATATLRVTIDAPFTAVQLPPEASGEVVGERTIVTFQVTRGRNYVARFRRSG